MDRANYSRRLLRRLAALAVLAILIWLARPYLRQAVRVAKLVREPAPTVLPVPVEGVDRSELKDTWGPPAARGGRTRGSTSSRRATPRS